MRTQACEGRGFSGLTPDNAPSLARCPATQHPVARFYLIQNIPAPHASTHGEEDGYTCLSFVYFRVSARHCYNRSFSVVGEFAGTIFSIHSKWATYTDVGR